MRYYTYYLKLVVDAGLYLCVCMCVCVCVYSVCVLVSPTIVGSGPEGSAEEVTVTLSSPTSLVCEAQSYPPAIITWLKDGAPFQSGRNVRVLPGQKSTFRSCCQKTVYYYTNTWLIFTHTHPNVTWTIRKGNFQAFDDDSKYSNKKYQSYITYRYNIQWCEPLAHLHKYSRKHDQILI